MLQRLYVKNLALIDEIEVEFEHGLNILTGETGAGKSIILGSVNLALGGRYTKDIIRRGADYGFVELTFLIENHLIEEKLKKMDIFPEEGCVILSRRLMEGRSVSRINGETVPMALLKEAAEVLIDIHGQHEHQSLLYKKNHLGIVDAFAKSQVSELKEEVSGLYKSYRNACKELEEADMDEASRAKELSFMRFEVSEIEDAALREDEDEELESSYRFMVNSKKISDGAEETYQYTSESSESVSENLSRAIRALSEIRECDERASQLYEQLVEVDNLLNDFNRELSDYTQSCQCSEEELYETETRLNEINRLKVKYGNRIEDILAYYGELQEKIKKLEDYENYAAGLKKQCEEEKKKLVTKHEFEKFRDVYKNHSCAPRSKLYLADGYDLMRVYTDGMNIKEKRVDKRRGVLILYALPDTVKLGLSEAQTYDVIWNTFHKIQQTAPTAMVYYGQETGEKAGKSFDEIGVLLPVHQFEKKMLMHLSEIDGIVLACREEMMKKAGSDSLDL